MKEKKLNLGSGLNKLKGYINLDYNKQYNPEVVWDLNKLPLPFKDNEFDEVLASHIIEHFDNPVKIMEELWRITKENGKIKVYMPHCSHVFAFGDLTHKWYPNGYSFDMFETSPGYYSKFASFKVRKVTYSCIRHQNQGLAKLLSVPINFILNLNRLFTEFFLCRILPIIETYYELEVDKRPLNLNKDKRNYI